jgi:hypothetical protein
VSPSETIIFSIDTVESTPTPTVPEFSWLVILPIFLSLPFIVVLFRKAKFGDSHD